jgi:hypothetical protein
VDRVQRDELSVSQSADLDLLAKKFGRFSRKKISRAINPRLPDAGNPEGTGWVLGVHQNQCVQKP